PEQAADLEQGAGREKGASPEQGADSEEGADSERAGSSEQDAGPVPDAGAVQGAFPEEGASPDFPGESAADGESAQSPVSAEAAHDAQISAAGGVVLGESELAGQADRSRVRRAPRYRRFAVLGGLLGLVVTAIVTPLAGTSELVDGGDIFLMLALTLVPVGILVTCGIAMLTDSAARKRK